MKRDDDGISKSLQPSQKLLFETRGSGGTYRVSLMLERGSVDLSSQLDWTWPAGSGSSVDLSSQLDWTWSAVSGSSVDLSSQLDWTWSAASDSPVDQQASPPQGNEPNFIVQSLVRGTYRGSLRIFSAGSWSSVDPASVPSSGQRDHLHRAVSPRSRRDQLL